MCFIRRAQVVHVLCDPILIYYNLFNDIILYYQDAMQRRTLVPDIRLKFEKIKKYCLFLS